MLVVSFSQSNALYLSFDCVLFAWVGHAVQFYEVKSYLYFQP